MHLPQVSSYFDRTPMWDAYTGRRLKARCQVTLWDTPRRDGMTTIRRTLFMKSGSKLPSRHAVIIGNQVWILARILNEDTWGNHVSRVGYVAQYAKKGIIARTDQVLLGGGLVSYVSRVWVKDVKDISTTSEGQGQYYIYYTYSEPVEEGGFIFVDGRWHIVRNTVKGTAGLMVASCNELEPDCIRTVVVVNQGVFDPVLEVYEGSQQVEIQALLLNYKDDYKHELPSREAEEIGDKRLRIASFDSDLISQSTQFEIDGVLWQVVNIEKRIDESLSVSIRRV